MDGWIICNGIAIEFIESRVYILSGKPRKV